MGVQALQVLENVGDVGEGEKWEEQILKVTTGSRDPEVAYYQASTMQQKLIAFYFVTQMNQLTANYPAC